MFAAELSVQCSSVHSKTELHHKTLLYIMTHANILESEKLHQCLVLKIIAEEQLHHRESAAWNLLPGVLARFILIKSYVCGG